MSNSAKPMVEMKEVKLQFGEKKVLQGVDLKLEKGEILVVMGASGSGKSTLLRLLLGVLPTNGGTIEFEGKDVTRLPRRELNQVRTKIGMVFQNAALISSMSVRENLAMPLEELSDKKDSEWDQAIDEKLSWVDLKEAKEKLPEELSGGMRKRAGLARALMLEPELVLFDEPSAGLDPKNSALIDRLILDLKEKHQVTSIVVTHEMASAFAVATRMVMLHEGKIVQSGTPEEFKKSENPVVQEFLAAYLDPEKRKEPHANSQK
jgi:phospholipid/cholesterol/gamma-HCH transport system ATP-binding protein